MNIYHQRESPKRNEEKRGGGGLKKIVRVQRFKVNAAAACVIPCHGVLQVCKGRM